MSIEDEIDKLTKELGEHPGRIGLVAGGENGEELITRVAACADEPPMSVGACVVEECPITDDSIQRRLSDSSILMDIEILFEPRLQVDPIQLLRSLSRRRFRIALWPGRISAGIATYSELGRDDWYESRLENVIVLRPRITRFPDEVPYTIERIA